MGRKNSVCVCIETGGHVSKPFRTVLCSSTPRHVPPKFVAELKPEAINFGPTEKKYYTFFSNFNQN